MLSLTTGRWQLLRPLCELAVLSLLNGPFNSRKDKRGCDLTLDDQGPGFRASELVFGIKMDQPRFRHAEQEHARVGQLRVMNRRGIDFLLMLLCPAVTCIGSWCTSNSSVTAWAHIQGAIFLLYAIHVLISVLFLRKHACLCSM